MVFGDMNQALTSTSVLEIRTAVSQLQARMVAVARLITQVLNDSIDGGLLDHARRIATRTTQLRFPTAAARHVIYLSCQEKQSKNTENKCRVR